jgi:hypothetical protein
VSSCQKPAPGTHRIVSDFGTRFDVSEQAFTIETNLQDMPPGKLYVVKQKGTNANLVVWHDEDALKDLKTPFPVISEHLESRPIRTVKGRVVGEDRWGYLKSGERWRYVRFFAGDAVGYSPVPPNRTGGLDQIIGTACFGMDADSGQ